MLASKVSQDTEFDTYDFYCTRLIASWCPFRQLGMAREHQSLACHTKNNEKPALLC